MVYSANVILRHCTSSIIISRIYFYRFQKIHFDSTPYKQIFNFSLILLESAVHRLVCYTNAVPRIDGLSLTHERKFLPLRTCVKS